MSTAANGATVRVNKVVIPTAGRGTRFLPATKAVPKELLPVVDRPALEYIVEEAADAGLSDVLFVNGPGKGVIDAHFRPAPDLEKALDAKGDAYGLSVVRRASEMADVSTVIQEEPRGLGHAVLCGAEHVGDEAFLVSLADMVLDGGAELVARMLEVRARYGGSVIALYEVPEDQIEKYGIAAVEATDAADVRRLTGLVEKPPRAEAPSNLAVLGRYLLDPRVFELLRTTAPGRGGEIQLTDAIQALIDEGAPVHAVVFTGRVFDTGDKLEYLKVVVRLATRDKDLGPDFRAWLDVFVAGEDGS